jgi:hypothetical protein
MQRVVDNAKAIIEKPAGLKAGQKVLNILAECRNFFYSNLSSVVSVIEHGSLK